MMYEFNPTIRKSRSFHCRPWLGQYVSRDEKPATVALPKLPRGVQEGPVRMQLEPGLYCWKDGHSDCNVWFLVADDGDRYDIARDVLPAIRRDVGRFVRWPCDIPDSAMGADAVRIPSRGLAWVAEITGKDERWGLSRRFLSRVGAEMVGVFYLERGRMYEVRGQDQSRRFAIVETDGRVWYQDCAAVWAAMAGGAA